MSAYIDDSRFNNPTPDYRGATTDGQGNEGTGNNGSGEFGWGQGVSAGLSALEIIMNAIFGPRTSMPQQYPVDNSSRYMTYGVFALVTIMALAVIMNMFKK